MVSKESWPVDGKDHRDVSEEGLYNNSRIENYLHSEQHTLIIAAKGMGKTLLLRAKKNVLEKEGEGHTIIPRDQEFDYPEIRWSLAPDGLEAIELWKNVWIFSFIFSALSHREGLNHADIKRSIGKLAVHTSFREELLDDLKNHRRRAPSHYMCEILQLGITEMNKFFYSSNIVDEMSSQFLTSSICIFVDAFDQTLTERFEGNLTVWKNAQIGLIYAAHRIRNSNKHIKVFASIRHEAWASFYSDDRQVIRGQALVLDYSKHELRQMFEHAVKKYARQPSIEKFLGLDTIRNGWMDKDEDPFEYIFRHSVGTPRSIMLLGDILNGASLQKLEGEQRCNFFRSLINRNSAEHLYADYLVSQRKIFLETLNSDERIKALLKLIPSNVLSGKVLASISQQFANQFSLFIDNVHPFCELLNVGVLGVVKTDPVTHKKIQCFRKPQEFDWKMQNILSDDTTYLIHPSLNASILQNRGDHYYVNPANIIGEELEWNDSVRAFPQVFISFAPADRGRLEPVLEKIGSHLSSKMPCAFWHERDSIPMKNDSLYEVNAEASASDIILVFLTRSCLETGWLTQEWKQKYQQDIAHSNAQVIYCMLDNISSNRWQDVLKDKTVIYLSGFEDELNEPINSLTATMELCLKRFWRLGE